MLSLGLFSTASSSTDSQPFAMAIEALCPNGHKILCPEDRAGRTARCPKCSAPFQIPEPKGNGPLPTGNPQTAAGHSTGAPKPAISASDDYDFAATAAVLASGSSPSQLGIPASGSAADASGQSGSPAASPP